MNATITITLGADGRVELRSTIDNKLVALGLLDVARDVILKTERPAPPAVETPSAELARRLLSGRNGG